MADFNKKSKGSEDLIDEYLYARTLTSHSPPRIPLKRKRLTGYRRPPVETQFKPGQSGNPMGRPKGSKNLRNAVEKMFTDTMTIREGNKVRRVPRLEAVLLNQLSQALKGDPRAIQAVCGTAKALGLLDVRPEQLVVGDLSSFSATELDEFERLLVKASARRVPK